MHKPKAWATAAEIINFDKVRWALMTFEPYKSPGSDGVYSILLQKGLDILLHSIVKVKVKELSQYAYRERRSTDTALHHLVGQVETQLEAKGYALGVFLDIEGAFDSTSNKIICETTERYQIPEAIRD